ncbi:uncharacterized protein LOC124652188 [Lolium rigidum]|uniref:uncharacterized protein LOC124652188 n=1 Tax=Lolium rigidum TaxID=89674 RepID=UPI001F5C1B1E|nr:uncharacterized protein LOC124652188 [Lolium rigidum]
MLQQMLRRFPCLHRLIIERTDAVPREEGMATRHDQHTHFPTLRGGLDQSLYYLTLFDFRGGKAELELLKAIVLRYHALRIVELAYSPRRMGHDLSLATEEALALRKPLLGIGSRYTGEIPGYEWCGSDMF